MKMFYSRCLSIIALGAGIFAMPQTACADWTAGNNMLEATAEMSGAALGVIEKNPRLGFASGICLFGGLVQSGKSTGWTRSLTEGKNYVFVAGGDKNALDVDLTVKDSTGKIVAKDDDNQAVAAVTFAPQTTGTYTITLTLHDSKKSMPACAAMTFLQEGGAKVSTDNLTTALANNFELATALDAELGGKAKLFFNDRNNQWALFGTVMAPGEERSLTNLRFPTGTSVFAAAGDDNTSDVDLFLLDSSKKIVEKDDDGDGKSIFDADTVDSMNYFLKIKNTKAKAPSFVVAISLKVVPK